MLKRRVILALLSFKVGGVGMTRDSALWNDETCVVGFICTITDTEWKEANMRASISYVSLVTMIERWRG